MLLFFFNSDLVIGWWLETPISFGFEGYYDLKWWAIKSDAKEASHINTIHIYIYGSFLPSFWPNWQQQIHDFFDASEIQDQSVFLVD